MYAMKFLDGNREDEAKLFLRWFKASTKISPKVIYTDFSYAPINAERNVLPHMYVLILDQWNLNQRQNLNFNSFTPLKLVTG